MSGEMKYRLRVDALTLPHMSRYATAIEVSKDISDNRGYFHFAGLHGAPGRWCWHHQFSQQSNLSGRVFLPWHRAYLHRLEQSLQDIDFECAIPWWDWTLSEGIPEAFSSNDFEGRNNPLQKTRIQLFPPQVPNAVDQETFRNPDPNLPVFSFPAADVNEDGRATLAEVTDYLVNEVTRFEVFNDLLETIHDFIHVYVGGSMADVTFAAFDPIFYSHHCMIDRIWAQWQAVHGIDNYPNGLKSIVLEPFGLTVEEVLNFETLGYEYADSVSDIDIGGSPIEG